MVAFAWIKRSASPDSTITYLLSDRQQQIRARSERAFLLLQRMLAVDEDIRKKWTTAFNKHEPACEQLGSVHLLSQGIYAFKVDSKGARTDLVFEEPPPDSLLSKGIEGLVLTEWKVANAGDAAAKFAAARVQADLYTDGPMAGAELTGYRYLIAVSLKELPAQSIPADDVKNGVVYRHINIVVEPDNPSKVAKAAARTP